VTKRYPDAAGGDAYVVRGLEREQVAAGHQVQVVTSRNTSICDARNVLKVGLPVTDEQIDSVNLRRILSMAALAARAFPMLRAIRPDIIHAHTTDLGWCLSLAARWYRIPCVITLHGTTIGRAASPRFRRLAESALLRGGHYERVLTLDPSTMPALRRLGVGDRLDYVPNGIDSTDFDSTDFAPAPGAFDDEPGPGDGDAATAPTVLFVGRLESVKGVGFLLTAFAAVLRGEPTARLLIVGSGSMRPELERTAGALGIGRSVSFAGARPRAELPGLYRQAAVFVLPSLYEGFPLVLLEAWAHGTPVVITRVGAVPHVCRPGVDAMIVRPGDADGLAGAIVEVLRDAVLAARLREGGMRRVELGEFTPAAVAGRVQGIYHEVIASGGDGRPRRRRRPLKAARRGRYAGLSDPSARTTP